ncbi:hypothetical protein Klosneuvirus_16_6 [Klosneuvirus KNV1]|uniref:Right handed beta helix domain-containing protein n=1 Tax=Klosneuvirus KNV1 TaxID=1977640 RepID=A0A1V0SLS7_9VIRU|nr:hypothetical protein Klosneuvirus_16_6 [Klosneuvirus KNV1]
MSKTEHKLEQNPIVVQKRIDGVRKHFLAEIRDEYNEKKGKIENVVRKNVTNKDTNDDNESISSQHCSDAVIVPHKHAKKTHKSKLTQDMFDDAKYGIVINKSGSYKLDENIKYKPKTYGTTAITITASNVILDLSKYYLKQDNSECATYGIAVARGVNNVKITGVKGIAQIRNFTLAGIRVFGTTDTILIENVILTQKHIKQLTNEELPVDCNDMINFPMCINIVVGEGDTGHLSMKGTNKFNLVKNLTIKNIISKRATIGCHIAFTFGIKIDNSTFTENTYYGFLCGYSWFIPGEVEGTITFPVAGDGVITNSHFDRNVGRNGSLSNPSDLFNLAFVSGISLYGCRNFNVENCTVNENFNDDYILAVDHDACNNITWKNCTTNHNVSEFFVCGGFHFSGSVPFTLSECIGPEQVPLLQDFNNLVENCVSNDNKGGFVADGFTAAYCQGIRFKNCTASGNSITPDGRNSTGFFAVGDLPGGENDAVIFENYVAQQTGKDGFGTVNAGFFIQDIQTNVIIKDCIANSNKNDSQYAGGIVLLTTRAQETFLGNVTIQNCITNGNGSDTGLVSGGIVVVRRAEDIPSELPEAAPIYNIIIEKSLSSFNHGDGIVSFGNVEGLIIKQNQTDLNTVSGISVIDNTFPVLVAGNISYANPDNYVGVSGSVIIECDPITLPSAVGLMNVSINNIT